MQRYLSVDIGGTTIEVARVSVDWGSKNPSANIEESRHISTSDYNQSEVLFSAVRKLLGELKTSDVKGIGVSVGGLVDYEKGVVIDWTDYRFIENYPIMDDFSKALGLPVSVRNDTECFAMGEWAFGAGKEKSPETFTGIVLGTGIGGCLLINGIPYKGAHGYAGEIGEIEVMGNLHEGNACGKALKEISGMEGRELYGLAGKGDSKAIDAFREYGKRVGAVIHSVVAVYDPEIIVLGGSVSRSFDFFKDSMNKHLQEVFKKVVWKHINVVPSELENAGLLGAVVPLLACKQ